MRKFFCRQAANIHPQIRLAPNSFAEAPELIGAEAVGLVEVVCRRGTGIGLNPKIRSSRTFLGWTNPVAPIITVGETAAWIADHRSFYLAHFFDKILADAADIWDFGILPNPNSVIDDATNVLDKMSVDIWRDRARDLVQQNLDTRVRRTR